MAKIKSVSIWKEGVKKTANKFLLHIEHDNMENSAKFHYRLGNDEDESLSSGYLEMVGDEYTSWDGSNNFAYIWAVNKLNLSIIE